MSRRTAVSRSNAAHWTARRAAFLAGASAIALMFAVVPSAHARQFGSGSPTIAPPTVAADAATEAAQQAANLAKQARDSLSRATLAIQAMQAAQAAARAAAQAAQKSVTLPASIPNGLGSGGLLPNVPAGWSGVGQPTQSVDSSGQTNVNVNQNSAQAILNWTTFNVGARTTLTFDQHGNASWVALNRVDASTGPSQILGNIKADGTVLVINQSGIIFGGASQINVGSLIASSANITDAQFKASGIYSAQVSGQYIPSFTGAGDNAAGGIGGKVIVESGAQLSTNAPTSVTQGGGYVLLMGTEVDNAGSITTPKGQVELAAGHDFVLRSGYGTDSNQYSTTRGNEVATGTWDSSKSAWTAGGGTVSNTGIAFAQQGDITLAGHTIVQDGALVSTTSVNQRGSIHLLNSASDASGSVTLTGNSLALILPELDSTDTALNSQRDALIEAAGVNTLATAQFDNLSTLNDRPDRSRVEIVTGGTVNFRNGSLTQAQGGQVSVSAVKRIFIEAGATIDVSGVQGVLLPMSANEIQVNIQGNELRDSPDNRDSGNLANKDVWIDLRDLILVPAGTGGYASDRYYTPGGLLEVSGYLNNTAHSIGEWAAVGGSITLSAAEVVAQKGSVFNVSGGSVQYQGGYLQQTYVIGSDGAIYNINDAPSGVAIKAVATGFVVQHPNWVQPNWDPTEIYQSPWGNKAVRWEDGYTVGRDAGQLILSTPTSVFEGEILAAVITGERQDDSRPSGVTDGYKLGQTQAALAGQLIVGKYSGFGLAGGYNTDVTIGDIGNITSGMGAADALPSNRANTVELDAGLLNSSGLGGLTAVSTKDVTVNASVSFANGAQVNLVAPSVSVNANITAHSGDVTVSNILTAGAGTTAASTVALVDAKGGSQLTLASGATIDTSGIWVNGTTDQSSLSRLGFLDGGNVTFDSTQNITLADKTVIDVSSGAAILANAKTQGGKGGNVTVKANHVQQNAGTVGDGTLVINGTIRGYGVTGGGTLTISAPGNLVIGDNAALAGGLLPAGTPTPLSVKLNQTLTIPAGQPLPAPFVTTFTSMVFDTPTPQDIKLGSVPSAPLGAAWTLPPGLSVFDSGFYLWSGGQTIPAGTKLLFWGGTNTIPAGTIVPSAAFPQGLPIVPFTATVAAGSTVSTPVTYAAGTVLPAGTVLSQTVAIEPAPELGPSVFSSGFSKYDINGSQGVVVSGNLNPVMPVYQFTSASYAVPAGSDPSQAMLLWTPPLFTENPQSGTLTQRGGASIALHSSVTDGIGVIAGGGSVVVDRGSSITVDPGQSISLDAFGQMNIYGDLTARGGSITLANIADGTKFDAARNFDSSGKGRGISIWVDDGVKFDVSGVAYSASDSRGRRYATASDGGSITINGGGAFVLLRPGAELAADGAQTVVDLISGSTVSRQLWATNGGSISLASSSGLYLDGMMHALAGGANAFGGSLSVAINTPIFQTSSFPNSTAPTGPLVPSMLVVTPGYQPSSLPSDIAPGTDVASLKFGQASISIDRIKAGGFDSLALTSGDYMQFNGNISLALGRSLILTAGAFTSGALSRTALSDPLSSGVVDLTAPYILLYGPYIAYADGTTRALGANPGAGGAPTNATFTAHGGQIDVQGLAQFGASTRVYDNSIFAYVYSYAPGFNDVNLISSGDIRFLPLKAAASGTTLTADQRTMLGSDWNITLDAAQIYPATNVIASVQAGLRPGDPETALQADSDIAITVGRTTADVPDLPMSVFGTLALTAPVVNQGGIVRAPLGSVTLGSGHITYDTSITGREVNVLPGSITSVSMDGSTIPYGGTVDGLTYTYNGVTVKPQVFTGYDQFSLAPGVSLNGQSVNVASGAVVDVSGGGTLAGSGFISGRGGSVDVLTTPLVSANPTTPFSKASDKVYAIMPGYRLGYAPVAPENGAGDPAIGQQVTIPAGVPGLAAGTYTLLPANYALLPGAYRVELAGSTVSPLASPVAIGSGTYAAAVSTGFANTTFQSGLPATALITSGASVRAYSQYNEQTYSDFFIANTAQFGGVRPLLPTDGRTLQLWFENPAGNDRKPALTFDGTALLLGSTGGTPGQVALFNVGEIYADQPTAGSASPSVRADDINAIGAPRLLVNGYNFVQDGAIAFSLYGNGNSNGNAVAIRDGVTLRAGEIFVVGGNISVGNNVTLTTIGQGEAPFDSDTTGMSYTTATTSVLALSNGNLDFLGSSGSGAISVGANSNLYSEGTLAFASSGASTLNASAHFGSRNIALAVGTINIGDASTIAAAGNPSGVLFDQALLNRLINGDPLHGAPALETITLSAAQSINLFGNALIDATGSGVNLVMNTSAIYGYGAAGDVATIAAGKITWNGISTATPPAIAAGGAGTGSGTLNLVADEIDFGQFRSLDTTTANRVVYGFNNVNITGYSQIVSAGNGKLYIYQAPSTATGAVFGQSGVGGNLTLATPLLTGVQKSIMAYNAGGALNVVAPAGFAPSTAKTTVSGAEIDLAGDSVVLGTSVLLPSGKFVVSAANDIVLDGNSHIALSGQPSMIQTATVYGFGGTAIFTSTNGNVRQDAGSLVDVSATNNAAGSITASAGNGAVDLGGAVNGTATGGYASGDFTVTAGAMSDAAFSALNAQLNQGGFFDARSFEIRTGDLNVGDGVKAHNVTISTDAGALKVIGTIDASGDAPGTIRLSGGNGLTLASSAVLDAHGNVLQVDSYGQPIEAKNRGHIELTAAGGTLTLSPNATMNLTTPEGVAYGDVQINANRTDETAGDIAIEASGPLNILGAHSIALNGFWTYDLPGGSVITQSTLDGYDVASGYFIDAALGNTELQSRIAGLSAYGSAYHLRPGVQITSSGDLSTSGDIDLGKYRYGPGADRDQNSLTYGAGEPMALVVRAAGGLTIKGSISDGFKASAGIPATYVVIDSTAIASQFTQYTQTYNGTYTFYQKKTNSDLVVVSDWTVPSTAGNFYEWWANVWWGNWLTDTNGKTYTSGQTIPAGTVLSYSKSGNVLAFDPTDMPVLGTIATPAVPGAAATSPAALMLAPGSLSASIRLVAGADIAAADQRTVLSPRALNGSGNLTLNDPNYTSSRNGTFFDVLRTGTGNLDLLAGGSFSEATPYGVYTAGTQSSSVTNAYNLIGQTSSGTSNAWYPEHGGDVFISAQQDVTGNIQIADNSLRFIDSDLTSNWLLLQGGGASSDPAAWYINFGSWMKTSTFNANVQLVGFQGIGTLGGGNLTVVAGRNAGVMNNPVNASTGLQLAVASTGRVLADGSLVQTGGGDLILKVGGVLNPLPAASATSLKPDYFGSVTDLRGNIDVSAGSVGALAQSGTAASGWTSYDLRAAEGTVFQRSSKTPGPIFTPGDGTVTIDARGDLVVGGASDAGMALAANVNGNPYTNSAGTLVASGGRTNFTLWQQGTAIDVYAAGGDVALMDGNSASGLDSSVMYPGTLIAAAANGNIRFAEPGNSNVTSAPIELAPSPVDQLELLADISIFGTSQVVSMSGADMSTLATPFNPLFYLNNNPSTSNASANAAFRGNAYSPIAFGEDTPVSYLHSGDPDPALVYAGVDIVDLTIGRNLPEMINNGNVFNPTHSVWYIAAKPFEVIAGRDIVGTGPNINVFANNGAKDISLVQAGRDIFQESVNIVGPGLLQVQAGRNLYQGYYGSLVSVGDVVTPANDAGGAGIATIAGVGASGPDYADFARLYFDPSNRLPAATPLAGSGKVAKTYNDELVAWLKGRFGYAGSASDALAFFLALPSVQQGVFVRQIYYTELKAGGREYNDANSVRYGSYLRGRQAIATLLPGSDANGQPIDYSGKITMFSGFAKNGTNATVLYDAGIATRFGGDIDILNPGGQTILGIEGITPGAGAGLITQGRSSNINVYSLGSVLLGQSRIMTTFGGSIMVWSAQGDINAGRGSKTTVIYTPPLVAYDKFGRLSLSSPTPSSGAGIATINPIPEVLRGDVDLIAPLGTIDAGEAGIRVSGNVNLAALQVLNAANIQVQGTATGLPTVQGPPVAALTSASNTAAATQQSVAPTQNNSGQTSVMIVEIIGYGGGGDAEEPARPETERRQKDDRQSQDVHSRFQVIGAGDLTDEQTEQLKEENRKLTGR